MSIFARKTEAVATMLPGQAADTKLRQAKGLLSGLLGVDPNQVIELVRDLIDELRGARADMKEIRAYVEEQRDRLNFVEETLRNVDPEFNAQMIEQESYVASAIADEARDAAE